MHSPWAPDVYNWKIKLVPKLYSRITQTKFEINELITCFPPTEDLKVLIEIKLTKQTMEQRGNTERHAEYKTCFKKTYL